MKNIISSVFAVSMLSMTAFGADFKPGEEIMFKVDSPEWGLTTPTEDLTSSNYTISSQSWTKGRDLISSVKLDNDDEAIIVTLKQNYTEAEEESLIGTIKVRDRTTSEYLEIDLNCTVGYNVETINIDGSGNISTVSVDSDSIYKVVADDSRYGYGTLMFQADDVDVTVRVYEDEVYYLGYNRQANRDVLLANADTDAEMDFLNFEAAPRFSSTAEVSIFGYNDDFYIYEENNGKLTTVDATWDDDTNTHVFKTTTLGNYVFSDVALSSVTNGSGSNNNTDDTTTDSNSGTTTQPNPDTGMGSIFSVAAAMTLVSVATAAAAVSSKK